MEPYQTLANVIVELAVKDYRIALKYHTATRTRKNTLTRWTAWNSSPVPAGTGC